MAEALILKDAGCVLSAYAHRLDDIRRTLLLVMAAMLFVLTPNRIMDVVWTKLKLLQGQEVLTDASLKLEATSAKP